MTVTNSTTVQNNTDTVKGTQITNLTMTTENKETQSLLNVSSLLNSTVINEPPVVAASNVTTAYVTANSNVTVVYVTNCTTIEKQIDPLSVKGSKIDPSGKECTVEIQTKSSLLHNKIDCGILMKYAKMPEPKKQDSSLMPSREKLKSWASNPPWWTSLFIAI
ncbi:unnamed protein product [Chilo suppressalis]|uniref:Uncharacterized protein n=1 Tax=Chilo suppressalis TaxID=168631 RepID=A0ABN8BF46_CHISP|nr:unnamed protein product [Chilo suppressalis]